MTIHAIQTGSVRIKRSQVRGSGHGMRRRLRVFTDPEWTDWIPTYAWLIDHPEGIIVVDTGQGRHLLDSVHSLHPYLRWAVRFRIERDEEIGPQLRALGVKPRDVQRVVLTHLHIDHDGGLAHFPESEILVSRRELRTARGSMGRLRGYLAAERPTIYLPTQDPESGARLSNRQVTDVTRQTVTKPDWREKRCCSTTIICGPCDGYARTRWRFASRWRGR